MRFGARLSGAGASFVRPAGNTHTTSHAPNGQGLTTYVMPSPQFPNGAEITPYLADGEPAPGQETPYVRYLKWRMANPGMATAVDVGLWVAGVTFTGALIYFAAKAGARAAKKR